MRGGRSGGPRERALAARGFSVPTSIAEEDAFLEAALAASLDGGAPIAAGPPAPAASGPAGSEEWVLIDEPAAEPEVDRAHEAAILGVRASLEQLSLDIREDADAAAASRAAQWRAETAERVAAVAASAAAPAEEAAVGLPAPRVPREVCDWGDLEGYRLYAVWSIGGSAEWAGIHLGNSDRAYEGLLGLLGGGAWSQLHFRRAQSGTIAEATALYQSRLRRYPTIRPRPRVFSW